MEHFTSKLFGRQVLDLWAWLWQFYPIKSYSIRCQQLNQFTLNWLFLGVPFPTKFLRRYILSDRKLYLYLTIFLIFRPNGHKIIFKNVLISFRRPFCNFCMIPIRVLGYCFLLCWRSVLRLGLNGNTRDLRRSISLSDAVSFFVCFLYVDDLPRIRGFEIWHFSCNDFFLIVLLPTLKPECRNIRCRRLHYLASVHLQRL